MKSDQSFTVQQRLTVLVMAGMELNGKERGSDDFPSFSCQMGKWLGLRDICFSVIFQTPDMGWGLENQGENALLIEPGSSRGFIAQGLSLAGW